MELNHSGMIYFALKEESNQVVHISEMVEKDRGKACECICLCCGHPLVAKLGRGKKTAHFSHLAHIWQKKEEQRVRQMKQMKADFIK